MAKTKVKKKSMVFRIPKAHDAFNMVQFLLRWKAHDEPLPLP